MVSIHHLSNLSEDLQSTKHIDTLMLYNYLRLWKVFFQKSMVNFCTYKPGLSIRKQSYNAKTKTFGIYVYTIKIILVKNTKTKTTLPHTMSPVARFNYAF